jgi:S1-C subfamily serine protease
LAWLAVVTAPVDGLAAPVAGAIDRAVEATVFIEVGRVFHGEEVWNTGTGFFVSDRGHVLTNSHVVSDFIELVFGDDTVYVEVNVVELRVVIAPRTDAEKVLPARVIDVDRTRDLALLEVNIEPPGFIELQPGREVALTEEVFVLGFPYGDMLTFDSSGKLSKEDGYPEVSVNGGRVTSLRRDERRRVVAVQTDADINPGNSGGPMIDAQGSLVGVVYAELDGDNQIGFAIAPGRVWHFLEQQRVRASFEPPYLTEGRRPIVVSVSPGALLDGTPASGRVVLRSDDAVVRELELARRDEGYAAVLEVPPEARGRLTVEIVLEDDRERRIGARLFTLSREDAVRRRPKADAPGMVLENEMTIHDYARKQAAAKAVEEGVVIASSPSADTEGSAAPDTTAVRPASPPVDLTELRDRARAYYRAGEYAAAAEFFAQIVAADPGDEVARDYLDLARGRAEVSRAGVDVDDPAAVHVTVTSRARRGTVRLAVDGDALGPFEFDRHNVSHDFEVPVGSHNLTVDLEVGGETRGSVSFERDFGPGTEWTLRIDHPAPEAPASIYLLER